MRGLLGIWLLITPFSGILNAQTLLVDPASAGGFASGNSFASNGWTVINDESVHGWTIGTPFSGNISAFTSPQWQDTDPTNSIDANNLGQSFHFFRDIAIPTGEEVIEITFQYRMISGLLSVGVAPEDYIPDNFTTNVPAEAGSVIFSVNSPAADNWVTITRYIPTQYAGTTIRLIFTGFFQPSLTIPIGAYGPAITNISLKSRPAITFASIPGNFSWSNPEAWLPNGIPVAGDNVVITEESTITSGPVVSIQNLTISGQLISNITRITGNLTINTTGKIIAQQSSLTIDGNFTMQAGAQADLRSTNLRFFRDLSNDPLQQLFEYQTPQQFEGNTIRGLTIENTEGLSISATGGRLSICAILNLARGTLVHNDFIELNHQTLPNVNHTLVNIQNSGSLSSPLPIAEGGRKGLAYSGSIGTLTNPYLIGSRQEFYENETLHEFTIGGINVNVVSPFDLNIEGNLASRFRLFGTLKMAEQKTVILQNADFPGSKPVGFPGSNTGNVFNNGHVEGGVAFRLNGTNLQRVWPVGFGGQQYVVGMYGINATNALVRVSLLASEEGTAGTDLQVINPLIRYRVELLEGSLEKVDGLHIGYNKNLSGFIEGDENNRRIAAASSLNGSYSNIGGPLGGTYSINSTRPEWDCGWINSNTGNFNESAVYSLALSSGNFAIMWRNNSNQANLLWDDASNWTGNTLPSASTPVILNAPGSTITVSENSSCSSLSVSNGTNIVIPSGINFAVGGN